MKSGITGRFVAGIFACACAMSAHATAPACEPLAGNGTGPGGSPRALHARDLVELREFGNPGVNRIGGDPFAVSPDGRHAALVLRRAQVERNGYCQALVVLDIDNGVVPRWVADAGGIDVMAGSMYGLSGLVYGAIRAPILRWSPDGRSIAYSRIESGTRQVWVVGADGGNARQLTASPIDIDDFIWLPDGGAIIYRSKPGLFAARRRIEDEGRSGFHYGDRFWPLASASPYLPADVEDACTVVSIEDGAARAATVAQCDAIAVATRDAAVSLVGADGSAWSAWLAPANAKEVGLPNDLHVASGDSQLACPDDDCTDVSALWRLDDHAILYLRRASPARSELALYRWDVEARSPVRLLQTADALIGCQPVAGALFCAREGATTPRKLVRIDVESGRQRTLYDPNPEFAELLVNPVERIYWTNAYGRDTFGDLVLPRDRQPGEKLPLIVVQYDSRGFLKGGTGDEYPVQLFASRGFAVLNVNQPRSYGLGRGYTDWNEVLRANQQDRMERRSILSSVETGVGLLVERGIVDPGRIGITGLSDGASTVTFAIINSGIFAAASVSTCCESPAMMSQLGTAYASSHVSSGYPPAGSDPDYWTMSSLATNAGRIREVPLLVQAADAEFRMALETFATLSAAGWPIDMYVFPAEAHIKNQPAHRLSIYERNLAWFDYWLKQYRDESYPRQDEITNWQLLREKASDGR